MSFILVILFEMANLTIKTMMQSLVKMRDKIIYPKYPIGIEEHFSFERLYNEWVGCA